MGAPPPRGSRPAVIRLAGVLLVLALLWHGFASAMVAGTGRISGALESVPGAAWVKAYALPMFRQDWMVFAPTPGNADTDLLVRARYADGSITGWFNITEADVERSILHQPVPSRMYLANFKLATWYRTSAETMPERLRGVMEQDFTHGQWPRELRRELLAAAQQADHPAVTEHLRHERAVTALAAGIARSVWGAGHGTAPLEAVQVRIVTRAVTPYAERDNPGYHRTSTTVAPGWRGAANADRLDTGVLQRMYGSGGRP